VVRIAVKERPHHPVGRSGQLAVDPVGISLADGAADVGEPNRPMALPRTPSRSARRSSVNK
jgi:hypothetical protein